MGLFSDFYNTVAKFFRPQDEIEEGASKAVATNRLKLVLMQDRTNLTPKILEQMRSELVDLLSKYLEMDKDLLELNFEHEGDQVALMLSIPVIRAKDEDEIEEALAANKTEIDNTSDDEEEDDDEENDNIEDSTEDFNDNSEVSDDIENIDSKEIIENENQEENSEEVLVKKKVRKKEKDVENVTESIS